MFFVWFFLYPIFLDEEHNYRHQNIIISLLLAVQEILKFEAIFTVQLQAI